MLEVINASKTFAKGTPNEHKALDHLNLSLKEGEFVTILGSNGAGKSTLFNAICGNFLLDEGSVILDAGTSAFGFHRPFIPGPDERNRTESDH